MLKKAMGKQPTSYKDLLTTFERARPPSKTLQLQKQKKPQSYNISVQDQNEGCDSHQRSTAIDSKPLVTHCGSLNTVWQDKSGKWVEQGLDVCNQSSKKQDCTVLAYNKFVVEATSILANIYHLKPPTLLQAKITYLHFLQTMRSLCFISPSYEPKTSDLITRLWHQQAKNISVGAFILLLAGILKLSQQINQQILINFGELYLWRLQNRSSHQSSTHLVSESSFPFHPNISQRSRTLAESMSPSRKGHRTCRTLQRSVDQVPLFQSKKGNLCSEALFKHAKMKSVEKKRDKSTSEVQYQKYREQLTFKPLISAKMKKINKKQIYGQQDCINRMMKGRVQRQIKKSIVEKGLPYNEKLIEKMRNKKYQQLLSKQMKLKVPKKIDEKMFIEDKKRIVLDIYLEQEDCVKLIIEDEDFRGAAASFVKQHGLSQELHLKLVKELQSALKFQLTRIEENCFEEDAEEAAFL